MPWLTVEKQYEFDGPKAPLDAFEDAVNFPRGDQVVHLVHLNARDSTGTRPRVGRLIALLLSLPPFAASLLSPFPNRRTHRGMLDGTRRRTRCWRNKMKDTQAKERHDDRKYIT